MNLENSVKMIVGGLTLDPSTKAPIVILRDESSEQNLPIWVGLLEATAMATALEAIPMPRPMTHDLLKNLLGELGATVDCVHISDLRDNTYFACIYLRIGDEVREIDARPSDAISLALRTESPIYVAKSVLETSAAAQVEDAGESAEEGPDFTNVSRDKWGEILEQMTPDDFKYKM